MEKRAREEIMERFYEKARKMDMPPEELARVPWPLLEQMLFPRNWEEEDDEAEYVFVPEVENSEYVFEPEVMAVRENNLVYDLYNEILRGKQQGWYTVEDYWGLPEGVRAELIDGKLFFNCSPSYAHQLTAFEVAYQISTYIRQNQGECHTLMAPLDVQLDCDDDTVVQPDIMISCKKDRREEWGIYGAPDMVIEVTSPFTRNRDIKIKLNKYREAGVREYWIIDLQKKVILIYFFERDINPQIYSFENDIPVAIFGNQCKINLSAIAEMLKNTADSQ